MKYVPTFIFGIILAVLNLFTFDLSAAYSPVMGFISSTPGLNEHSLVWLSLMFHDSLLVLILSAFVIFMYRYCLPNLPFNWRTMVLMQIPMTFLMLRSSVISLSFDTVYGTATSVAYLIAYISVLVVFTVSIGYNKHINRN
jgi:hypothetical protein